MSSYSKIHKWQTRLVLIKPNADPSASLELSLVVVDLVALDAGAVIDHNTLVTYDALSYAWGIAQPSIHCICDGHAILLRDNLASALKHLRLSQEGRYIWVDFLCINQDDDVEKAVQIPRMGSIYAKASTVIIWLGDSPAIANLQQRCHETCRPNIDFLICPNHKEGLWDSILDYTWFKRTWVRQEVFAAKKLKICSPYFSTSWELFNKALSTLEIPDNHPSNQKVANLTTLNHLYSGRVEKAWLGTGPAEDLLRLLILGRGFQASVPHDHVFSVLGMVRMPKHDMSLFPVTYEKTYEEICGDVTRFFIRNSRNTSILRLCSAQTNKSYAFSWPAVEMPPFSTSDGVGRNMGLVPGIDFLERFDADNPIREVGALAEENVASIATSGRSMSSRPLVLHGRAWGTLRFRGSYPGQKEYFAEHVPDEISIADSPPPEDVDENRYLLKECGTLVSWECHGNVKTGDIFVSLEPGPSNFILRKCAESSGSYAVVAWALRMNTPKTVRTDYVPTLESTTYYLAVMDNFDGLVLYVNRLNDPPGPMEKFSIQ